MMHELTLETAREKILTLSHTIGRPELDLVILAEGNTSIRTEGDRMLVKASGSNLAEATAQDFVEVELAEYLQLVHGADASDDDVAAMMKRATTNGDKKPSVESLLHAVCLQVLDVNAVVHTHPTPVNALLCSDQADALTEGSLFPDQIVVLGQHPLMVDYIDPGLPLAASVDAQLKKHIRVTGSHPKVIYLRNHGMFALGGSAEEAVQITLMAVKAARVTLGALSAGAPVYMTSEHASRINTRPDELHRRALLADN